MGSRRSKGCQCTLHGYLRGGRWLLVALLSLGGLVTTTVQAAEAPDAGLLEFLGSVDTEDKDWNDYLARTDIDKIARRAGNGAGNPGGAAAPARPKPADPPGIPAADPPPDPPATSSPPVSSPPVAAKPVTPP
jgi:hypothetical protein